MTSYNQLSYAVMHKWITVIHILAFITLNLSEIIFSLSEDNIADAIKQLCFLQPRQNHYFRWQILSNKNVLYLFSRNYAKIRVLGRQNTIFYCISLAMCILLQPEQITKGISGRFQLSSIGIEVLPQSTDVICVTFSLLG